MATGPVEVGVERAINYAHPSSSELCFDAVMPESLADHLLELGPRVYSNILLTGQSRLAADEGGQAFLSVFYQYRLVTNTRWC